MAGSKPILQIYDTSLRDGAQGEGISYSVQDKVLIARKLDEAGFHFIEGGWPGAAPKESEFFEKMKGEKLRHAKLVAFGSTMRAGSKPEEDAVLAALLTAGTEVVTIFGKSWDFHVREVFKVELEENLRMISESVKYLRSKGREVIYDAEHFFDGYASNSEYALKTLAAARDAGATVLVLCETNGGRLPSEVFRVVTEVKKRLNHPLGIHTHNDSGCAVANAIAAVEAGAIQVQGTVNGIGERTGNCDLTTVIANAELKMGFRCLPEGKLAELSEISLFVNEICNMVPAKGQPYVGQSAFAHKGGVHIDAVKKNPQTYEHVKPELVGNRRKHLVSEVGGRTNIILKAEELGIELKKDAPETMKLLQEIQRLENDGYQFEGAEASVELLIRKETGKKKAHFTAVAEIKNEHIGAEKPEVKALVRVAVGGQTSSHETDGDGPVDALGKALQEALAKFYPSVSEVKLDDYKVRIVNSNAGTAAKVRVVIEFHDKDRVWATVGVSTNIIEASWKALMDAYEYKLMKEDK